MKDNLFSTPMDPKYQVMANVIKTEVPIYITPDGDIFEVVLTDDIVPFKNLQAMVDGYVEVIWRCPEDGQVMVVDEDGLHRHRRINEIASRLANMIVVGNVVYGPRYMIVPPHEEET